jgi:hypothetical protein
MVEILNFKKQATIIKLNAAETNLNVWVILMSHCGRDKNMENMPLNWLIQTCHINHILEPFLNK